MANNPFDRMIINPLEKPLADDINAAQSYIDQAFRFFLRELFKSREGAVLEGFLSNGLQVVAAAVPDLTVTVKAGLGFQQLAADVPLAVDGIIGLNDLESYKPIPLLADLTFAVPVAPSSPNTRIDIIEVRADRFVTDPSNRQVFNELSGQFEPDLLNKTLTWALDGRGGTVNAPSVSTQPISYKVGETGNPGAPPVTSPGYIKLCEIAVASDDTDITDGDITDFRFNLRQIGIALKTFTLDLTNGFNTDDWQQDGNGSWECFEASGNDDLWLPITGIQEGDIIDGWSFYIASNGGTNTLGGRIIGRDRSTVTEFGVGATSAAGQEDVVISESNIEHVVLANHRYYLRIRRSATSALAAAITEATVDLKILT